MALANISLLVFLFPLGILCLFKPFLLVFLFAALPVLRYVVTPPSEEISFTTIAQFGSVSISAEDYLIFIMTLCLLRFFLTQRHTFGILFNSTITKAILVLFLWDIFIAINSYFNGVGIEYIMRTLSMESLMFIAIFIPLIVDLDNKKERFFKFVFILAFVFVIMGLWRYFISHEVKPTSSGTLMSLDTSNDIVILLFPVCYILFYSDFFRKHRTLLVLSVAFLAVGISLTGHRSGWIVLIFALFMSYLFSNKKIEIAWIPLWGLSLLIIVIFVLPMYKIAPGDSFIGDFVVRFNDTYNLENPTTQWRLDKWKHSGSIMKETPFLGLGTFPVYTAGSILDHSVHNIFVRKFIFEGLLGFSLIIIFFCVILKQYSIAKTLDKKYARFLTIYILSFILFSMFNTSFTDTLPRLFFFFAVGLLNAEILKFTSTKKIETPAYAPLY